MARPRRSRAEHVVGLPPDDPKVVVHGQRAERVVAACFTLAFLAGCGFIVSYVGLGVHSVDKTLRSNLALGLSLTSRCSSSAWAR